VTQLSAMAEFDNTVMIKRWCSACSGVAAPVSWFLHAILDDNVGYQHLFC
jgi:hypothetical protein